MTERPDIPRWDRFWAEKDDLEQVYRSSPKVLEAVMRALPPDAERVLEVGAGTGRDTAWLSERGLFAIALDSSPAAWSIMARSAPGLVGRGLVGGDALHLPFADATFDVVFHQGVLEHFGNPTAFLAENSRVTRPGGLLVVDVPQTFHPWTFLKRMALRLNRWFAGWETEYTIGQLQRLVLGAGYEVIETYGDWMVPSLAYRLLRHAAGPMASLPLEPRGPKVFRRARREVRDRLLAPRIARYLAHTIGIVARKPHSP
ncbi:MAG: class I SAM-dependent methyltransferase [Gemmatimonadetes bacterium]|nr:class I SAM-dependent methyltransferase [Gemmatimonadota bacterium]